MNQLFIDHKEILIFCVSALGILLSLAFGGILSWRHKICLEYESRRDVAINILRDRFVQRTSDHYADIADELRQDQAAVEEIYKRCEQQTLIRELAKDLEDQNRVKRIFRWLDMASLASFGCLWGAIVVVLIGVLSIWIKPPFSLVVTWSSLLGLLMTGFVSSVTIMFILDGRFFRLVHRVIEPEGE